VAIYRAPETFIEKWQANGLFANAL
jgi:hypothetical protein